jgi:hypothetical protein
MISSAPDRLLWIAAICRDFSETGVLRGIQADGNASAHAAESHGQRRPAVPCRDPFLRCYPLERRCHQTVPQTRNGEIDEGAQLERQAVLLVIDQMNRTGGGLVSFEQD